MLNWVISTTRLSNRLREFAARSRLRSTRTPLAANAHFTSWLLPPAERRSAGAGPELARATSRATAFVGIRAQIVAALGPEAVLVEPPPPPQATTNTAGRRE